MPKRVAREVWEYDSMADFEADGGAVKYGHGAVIIAGEYYVDDANGNKYNKNLIPLEPSQTSARWRNMSFSDYTFTNSDAAYSTPIRVFPVGTGDLVVSAEMYDQVQVSLTGTITPPSAGVALFVYSVGGIVPRNIVDLNYYVASQQPLFRQDNGTIASISVAYDFTVLPTDLDKNGKLKLALYAMNLGGSGAQSTLLHRRDGGSRPAFGWSVKNDRWYKKRILTAEGDIIPITSIVAGKRYAIYQIITGNWTSIGAASATPGTSFIANSTPPTGTGLAMEEANHDGVGLQSPSFWIDGNGQCNIAYMTVSKGAGVNGSVGWATATNPLGPWTKSPTPIIGKGVLGVTGNITMPWAHYEDGKLYVYYCMNGSVYLAVGTTPDDLIDKGIVFNKSYNVRLAAICNVTLTKVGNKYLMSFCSKDLTDVVNPNRWGQGMMVSDSLTGPFTFATTGPFTINTGIWPVIGSVEAGTTCVAETWVYNDKTGIYTGLTNLTTTTAANFPNYLYVCTSTDAINWTRVSDTPICDVSFEIGYDQSVNSSIVEWGNRRYILHAALNNTSQIGGIDITIPGKLPFHIF